jgi:hypothetical protein
VSTFVLIYHEKDLSVGQLGKFVRITDRFIPIDDNYYFMIYHYTSQADSYKAAQKLLFKLDDYFQDTTTCIAIDEFDTSNLSAVVLSRLKQIIIETRKHSFRRIEDDCVLDMEV